MSPSADELDNTYYSNLDNIEDVENENTVNIRSPIQVDILESEDEDVEEDSEGDSSDTLHGSSESEITSHNDHDFLSGNYDNNSNSDKGSAMDESFSSQSSIGSVACYEKVEQDWSDYLDGGDESLELKEMELKVKLVTAVKKIGFGLKEDAFLELIEIYRDPLVLQFVVDINNFTIPPEKTEKTLLPLKERIFYTTCIHLSGLVENSVFFLLQALTINPHDGLFYKTSKAAIEQHQFRYAIYTLLRCKKSKEVHQGLLICYYFTANKYGLMNVLEVLFKEYTNNVLAAAIINFMKNDNYKFIDERFPQELLKRYTEYLTPDIYKKENYGTIYEKLVAIKTYLENKPPDYDSNESFDLKIRLHKDMNVQDFIKRLFKAYDLLASNKRFMHANYFYAYETLEVQAPPVECVQMEEKFAEISDDKSSSDILNANSRTNPSDDVNSGSSISPETVSTLTSAISLLPDLSTFESSPLCISTEINGEVIFINTNEVLRAASNNLSDHNSDIQSPLALFEKNVMESSLESRIILSQIQDPIYHTDDSEESINIIAEVRDVVEHMILFVSEEVDRDDNLINERNKSGDGVNSFGHLTLKDYGPKTIRTRNKCSDKDRYSDDDSFTQHLSNLKYWMYLEDATRPESLLKKYLPSFSKDGCLAENSEFSKTYYEEREENVMFEVQDYFQTALEEFGENKSSSPINLIAHFLEFVSKQYGKVIPKRCHALLFKLYELFVETMMDYRTEYRYYPVHIMMAELKNSKALEICEIIVLYSHYYIDDDLGKMGKETLQMIKDFSVRFVWAFSFDWNRDSIKTRKLSRHFLKSILIYSGREIWSFKESRHVINLRTFYRRAYLIMKLFIKNHIVEEYEEELWQEVIFLITSQLDWMQETEEDRICFLSMLFKAYIHVNEYNSSCKIAIILIDAISEFSRTSTNQNPYSGVAKTVFYLLNKSVFKETNEKIERNVAQDLGFALFDYFKVGKNLHNVDLWLLCVQITKVMAPLIENQDDVMTMFKEIEFKSTNPLPSRSLMIFEMAHSYLSDLDCCTIDDGALLKAYLKELKRVTRKNEFIYAELNSNKNNNTLKLITNSINFELNQCICCLFKDITLKCRSKVYEHETENIEATWELANIIFPLLIPGPIPVFDDKSKISSDILEIITKKFDFVLNFECNKGDRFKALKELDEFWETSSINILSLDFNDDLSGLLKWPRIKMLKKYSKKAYLSSIALYVLSYMKFQAASTKMEAIAYGKQFLISAKIKKLIPLESSALAIIALSSSYQLLDLPLEKQVKHYHKYLLPFYMSLCHKPDEPILQFEFGCTLYQLRGLMKRYLENENVDFYWREKLKIWIAMLPKKIIVFLENARKFDPEEDVYSSWTIDYFMAKSLGKQLGISLSECLSRYHAAAIALRKSGDVTGAKMLRGTQQGIESMEIYYKVHSHIYKLFKQYEQTFDQKTKGYLGSEIKIAAAYINIFKEHDVVKKYEYQDHEFVDTFEYDVSCDLRRYNSGIFDNITTEGDFEIARAELIQLCIEAFENIVKKFNHYKVCYRLAIVAEENSERNKFGDLLYGKIFNVKKKLSVLHNIFENFPFIKCVDIQRNSNSKYHIAKILKLAYEAAWRSKSPLKMGHLLYNVMVSTLSGSYLFEKDFTRLRSSCIRALEGYANKAKGLIANSTETSIPNDLLIIYECFSKTKFVTETNLIKDMESIIPFTTYKRILKKRKAVPDEDGRQKQAKTAANENIMSLLSSIQHLARGA